jgi:penicillin-binding protein 2
MMDVRQRLGTLMIVTVCLFGTLLVRVAWLQTVRSKSFQAQAELNTKSLRIVPAPRGKIKDRNGTILVDNQVVSVIMVTKSKLPAKKALRQAVFDRLQNVLSVDAVELLRRFNRVDNLEGVEVARNVSESAVVYLGEHAEDFPGVSAILDSQRVYPQGKLAPHILGYVSDIGDDIKNPRCNARYQTGDRAGKAGVEYSYECVLRGMPGLVEYTVDRRNIIISSETRWIARPIPGADIQLTIDADLQRLVEKRVRGGLFAARQHSGEIYVGKTVPATPFRAPAGSAVVFDSTNGAILAMASYPDYDPSEFVAGISASDYEGKYGADTANSPLTNRVISGQYSPGSTAKPFVAVSAFNNGLINAKTTIEDKGSYNIQNCKPKPRSGLKCTFYNAGKTPHGKVDLRRSLTVSSDVYYYRLGDRFWTEGNWPRDGIQETYKEFGFGGDTGIALPNEKGGKVPTPQSLLEENDPGSTIKWRTGDTLNVAIGQGTMLVTPLQLAAAYGALANDGQLMTPKIAFDTPPPPQLSETESDPSKGANTTKTGVSDTTIIPFLPTSSTGATTQVAAVAGRTDLARWAGGGRFGLDQIDPSADLSDTEPSQTDGLTGDTTLPNETSSSSTIPPVDALSAVPTGVTLTPVVHRPVDLSADVRGPIIAGLRGVVADGAGTANPAFVGFPIDAFPVSGKTGTAQVWKKHDTALFVGFGGPQNRFVVAVVLEQAGFGGQAAAPVARRIFEGLDGFDGGDVAYVTTGPLER